MSARNSHLLRRVRAWLRRVIVEGGFGDAKVGPFATIANLFRHGFVRAFNPIVGSSVHADNILPGGKSAAGTKPLP